MCHASCKEFVCGASAARCTSRRNSAIIVVARTQAGPAAGANGPNHVDRDSCRAAPKSGKPPKWR
eukprot:7215893-Prorocentrum_lima.AAC.1